MTHRIIVGHESCGCEIYQVVKEKGYWILAVGCGGDVFAVEDGYTDLKHAQRHVLEYLVDETNWCRIFNEAHLVTPEALAAGRLRLRDVGGNGRVLEAVV